MKLKCPLSGVTYQVAGLELLFCKAEHPIFNAPLNKVLGKMLPVFAKGNLEQEELHIFGTYLLRKMPIERWEVPLLELADLAYWEGFWSKNIQQLSSMALRLEAKEIKKLPTLAVTREYNTGTRPLSVVSEWMKDLDLAIREYYSPISQEAKDRNKLFRSELGQDQYTTAEDCNRLIEKALRGSLLTPREKKKFPEVIANWAAKVGEFPMAHFTKENGQKVTIAQYWKQIIISTFESGPGTLGIANLLSEGVSIEDMDELLEHCMVMIPSGTMHSRALFMELEKVKDVIQEFRPGSSTKAVNPNISIEVLSSEDIAQMLKDVSPVAPVTSAIDTDPLAPKKENYPTLSSFLKAKMHYSELKKKGAEE